MEFIQDIHINYFLTAIVFLLIAIYSILMKVLDKLEWISVYSGNIDSNVSRATGEFDYEN